MSLSKVRNFFTKHGNKFIIGGMAVGGFVLLARYAQVKLKEWQENEAQEFLNRTRKQQHFESITRTCNQTIKSLSLGLNEIIAKGICTEDVIDSLKNNPKNKIDVWNDLKVKIFSKIGCYIYLSTILVITLRLQLSIIGGYLYKDPNSVSSELQEKYLSHCQNLLRYGVDTLSHIMETACQNVLAPVTLNKQIKLSDLETMFWSIQAAVEDSKDSPIKNMKQYILTDNVPETNGSYNSMLQDTADLLDSEEVRSVAHHCISRSFILMIDLLSEHYADGDFLVKESAEENPKNNFVNAYITNSKPLAKLLPIVNSLFSQKHFPDRLTQILVTNEKIHILGANVYESLL